MPPVSGHLLVVHFLSEVAVPWDDEAFAAVYSNPTMIEILFTLNMGRIDHLNYIKHGFLITGIRRSTYLPMNWEPTCFKASCYQTKDGFLSF